MTRVLVTGADGFIGRRLCKRLLAEKYEVLTHSISDGDISSFNFELKNIDWIIHLAGLISVPESWENPKRYYAVNVFGTENILELCRRNGCGITFISSYVYGHPQYNPIDENHPISPNSPYNHSKYLAEELCRFYNRIFNMPVVIFRPFNIYGPGQSKNFLIPEIISQLFDNEREEIKLLDLTPKRDYIYVDDVVEALVKSIDQESYKLYNLGSGYSISVLDLVNLTMDITGINKKITSDGKSRNNEVTDMVASIEKAKLELKWSPRVNLKEGLIQIIAELKN